MKKGSTNWAPGRSCKDIRQSEDSVGDGEFWIDPDASGNPLKVYCDMTTDKGKKISQEEKKYMSIWKRLKRMLMRNSIIRKAMKCLDEEDINMHPGTHRGFEFLMYPEEREYENSKTVVDIGNLTQCGRGRENFNKLPRNHCEARRHPCIS